MGSVAKRKKALCFAPFCGERIDDEYMFCVRHWKSLPRKLCRTMRKERIIGERWGNHPNFAFTQALEDALDYLKKEHML